MIELLSQYGASFEISNKSKINVFDVCGNDAELKEFLNNLLEQREVINILTITKR